MSKLGDLAFQKLGDIKEDVNEEKELFGFDRARVIEVDINKLVEFKNHPFEVNDDDKMKELVESILEKGVVTPIIARKISGGKYEIVSGHRRTFASKKAELKTVPVIVMDLSDDEATVLMVDSNIQRTNIKVSERVKSLKMKYDSLKRQGKRTDLTSGQLDPKLSSEELGETEHLSASTIKRYIRLNMLIPELLEMLDVDRLNFIPAVHLSFLTEEEQGWVCSIINESKKRVGLNQAMQLREKSEDGILTEDLAVEIIVGRKKETRKVSFNDKELKEYFPEYLGSEQIKEIIKELLENWKEGIENG